MGFYNTCFKFYRVMQKLIAPTLKYSQSIYEEILSSYIDSSCIWLDLGCGRQLLSPWRLDQERILVKEAKLIVGCDYDQNSIKQHRSIEYRVQGDISNLPFKNNSFNLITSNMVFEHLNAPDRQVAEIYRILKPGGILIFHTPNLLGYGPVIGRLFPKILKEKLIWLLENRRPEDVFPTFYRINTRKKIESISKSLGFQLISLRFIVSSAQLIMIPPLVILELILIRLLMTRFGRSFRSNIIAVLKKPLKI